MISHTSSRLRIGRPLSLAVALAFAGALVLDGQRSAAPRDVEARRTADAAFAGDVVFRPVAPATSRPAEAERGCTGSFAEARPVGSPGLWLTGDDYPAEALRAEHQGFVTIMFDVDRGGGIGQCRIARSSGHPELDAASCRAVTTRGRYRPSRDAGGCPVATTRTLRLRWVIPEA